MPRLAALFVVIAAAMSCLALTWRLTKHDAPSEADQINGEVRDDQGPVAGALVRIKGCPESVESNEHGRFRIARHGAARITASKDGYFIAGASLQTTPLVLRLHRLPTHDCETYCWVDPTPDRAAAMNCGNCHQAMHAEWQNSGHARSSSNRRFLNLYEGADWHGKADVGWNLLKDYPEGAGVCSSCHAPTQKVKPFAQFDIRDAAEAGPGLSGVHCDYCHKARVVGDGEFGLTHGRYQLELLRPEPQDEQQLFFGPLDDVDRGDDVFSLFQRDSRLCAACHEGVVFGVPVYTTYSEWRASPAARSGVSCQNCHMAPTGKMSNIAPGHGGIRRDPATLANHRFFDGRQLDMLRRCLKLEASARRGPDGTWLETALSAESVGHRVPTGFIDRQVILFVEAWAGDKPLSLVRGPVLPDVMGSEAGRAGRLYAKVIRDEKGQAPAPFWRGNPASMVDTRLVPGQSDRQRFLFPPGTNRIRVQLVHRRFWKQVADEKTWPSDEQVIIEREFRLDEAAPQG